MLCWLVLQLTLRFLVFGVAAVIWFLIVAVDSILGRCFAVNAVRADTLPLSLWSPLSGRCFVAECVMTHLLVDTLSLLSSLVDTLLPHVVFGGCFATLMLDASSTPGGCFATTASPPLLAALRGCIFLL